MIAARDRRLDPWPTFRCTRCETELYARDTPGHAARCLREEEKKRGR